MHKMKYNNFRCFFTFREMAVKNLQASNEPRSWNVTMTYRVYRPTSREFPAPSFRVVAG